MAKSKSRSGQRGNLYSSANRVAAPVYRLPSAVSLLEDRRFFHPLRDFRPLVSSFRRSAEVIISPRRVAQNVSRRHVARGDVFKFRVPMHVALCAKRETRREVLHAFKFTGKGAGAKRRNRNYWSNVSCR